MLHSVHQVYTLAEVGARHKQDRRGFLLVLVGEALVVEGLPWLKQAALSLSFLALAAPA